MDFWVIFMHVKAECALWVWWTSSRSEFSDAFCAFWCKQRFLHLQWERLEGFLVHRRLDYFNYFSYYIGNLLPEIKIDIINNAGYIPTHEPSHTLNYSLQIQSNKSLQLTEIIYSHKVIKKLPIKLLSHSKKRQKKKREIKTNLRKYKIKNV